MFDPFTLSLIGAGIGSFANKDPLKGALMGGALGYGGGLLAAPTTGATGAGLLAEQAAAPVADAAITQVANPVVGANPGLLEYAAHYAKQAKPYLDAAGSASQVAGMFGNEQPPAPIQASPITMPQGPNMAANSMMQSINQDKQSTFQADAERRARRWQYLNGG